MKRVDSQVHPKSFKQLNLFLKLNCAPTCFVKQGGNMYKLLPDTTFLFVCRNIDQLTLEEYLKLALNSKFRTS
jgi:hypothetical protein